MEKIADHGTIGPTKIFRVSRKKKENKEEKRGKEGEREEKKEKERKRKEKRGKEKKWLAMELIHLSSAALPVYICELLQLRED